MPHHRDAGFENLSYGVDDFNAAFELQRVGAGFLA